MFDQAIADEICDRIADGESLRSICLREGMPTKTTVFRWLADEANEAFRDQYARAREMQADTLFDEIQDIADDGTNDYVTKERDDGSTYEAFNAEHVQRSKLRIDSRKWMAGKLRPKVYGEASTVKLADADGKKIDPSSIEGVTRLAALAQALANRSASTDDPE